MVPQMILRLGFVDLVDHLASSILARLVALSELSEPSTACDCVLVKLQASLLGELQIAPTYCILKSFPSTLVWRNPWFRKITRSFLHAICVFHRVHCSEEYCLSSSLEATSSWN